MKKDHIPYRQIHLDFHTNETIGDVGSMFNADEFVRTLKDAHVNSINLFTKCHHGMYYYPSSVGTMHPALHGFDLFGAQMKACTEAGIRVIAYSCVSWNEDWARRHPEWLMISYDGIAGDKLPFEEKYPVIDGQISLRVDKEPAQVFSAPDETAVPFSYADGYVTISPGLVSGHTMLVVR